MQAHCHHNLAIRSINSVIATRTLSTVAHCATLLVLFDSPHWIYEWQMSARCSALTATHEMKQRAVYSCCPAHHNRFLNNDQQCRCSPNERQAAWHERPTMPNDRWIINIHAIVFCLCYGHSRWGRVLVARFHHSLLFFWTRAHMHTTHV